MKKVLTTLVVFGIILCLCLSLGVTARADDAFAILAVNGSALNGDELAALKAEYPNGIILDVSGSDGDHAGFDMAFVRTHAADAMMLGPTGGDYEALYLGEPITKEYNGQKITLVGVNGELDAGTLAGIISSVEGPVVAVGESSVADTVFAAGIHLLLVTDEGGDALNGVTASADSNQTVKVGANSDVPVLKITADGGSLQAVATSKPYIEEDQSEPEQQPEPEPEQQPESNTGLPAYSVPVGYTVTYFANGGAGEMEDSVITSDGMLTLPECGFTAPEGKQFDCWQIGNDFYQAGETTGPWYIGLSVNAIWKDIVYTVTYDANGGSGAVDASDVTAGQGLTLPDCGFTAPEGYVFAGWLVDGTLYQPWETTAAINGDAVAQAQWDVAEPIAVTYTVTYDPNGGSGAIDPVYINQGSPVTLPTCTFTAPEGYEFAGWKVGEDIFTEGYSVDISGDTTVYAQWNEIIPETYDIVFMANEGDEYTYTIEDIQPGAEQQLLTFSSQFTAPEGKQFANWVIDGNTYAENATIQVTGNLTAVASYTDVAPAAATGADPGLVGSSSISWTIGGADGAKVSFSKAVVNSVNVSVAGAAAQTLTAGVDYDIVTDESTGNNTINLRKTYLDSLTAGDYYVYFTFNNGADGTTYAPYTLSLHVSAATEKDPGMNNASTNVTWTINGEDEELIGYFTNAVVSTVTINTVGGAPQTLTQDVDYDIANYENGTAVSIHGDYLNALQAGYDYEIKFTFNPDADGSTYRSAMLTLHVNAAQPGTEKDPGLISGSNEINWTNGSNDSVTVSFSKAVVNTVSVSVVGAASQTLTAGVDYDIVTDESTGYNTISFRKSYLDTLAAGNYYVYFTFQPAADGSTYSNITMDLKVQQNDQKRKETWNRAGELSMTFDGRTPSGLQIRFGSDNWVTAKENTDFRLAGSNITLLPAMVNGGSRWQAWGNGGYTFRVTFTSGDPVEVSVTLEGATPTTAPTTVPTATPQATNQPQNNGPTSPVTGDTTPIMLYVIILVVLIVALAVVIIVVMNQKKKHR